MKNKQKGFTLIEMIAVVIILGVILIIVVPSISNYINNSRKSAYIADLDAYVKSAVASFAMKEYGSLPIDGEILIVPFKHIELEKNNTHKSPYGPFDLERSYIVALPTSSGNYKIYVNSIDSAGYGIKNGIIKELDKVDIKFMNKNDIATIDALKIGTKTLVYDSIIYQNCIARENDVLLCTK